MDSCQYTCKCGKMKTWIIDGKESERCPDCGRKYIGRYNKKTLTIDAELVNIESTEYRWVLKYKCSKCNTLMYKDDCCINCGNQKFTKISYARFYISTPIKLNWWQRFLGYKNMDIVYFNRYKDINGNELIYNGREFIYEG